MGTSQGFREVPRCRWHGPGGWMVGMKGSRQRLCRTVRGCLARPSWRGHGSFASLTRRRRNDQVPKGVERLVAVVSFNSRFPGLWRLSPGSRPRQAHVLEQNPIQRVRNEWEGDGEVASKKMKIFWISLLTSSRSLV